MTEPLFEPLPQTITESLNTSRSPSSYFQDAWSRFRQRKLALGCLIFLGILGIFAVVGPWIAGHTYYETHLKLHDQPPNAQFWFGTDDLGRDLFTRVAFGARISLFVGLTAALIDVGVGILYGGIAGYAGGRLDAVLMRGADILYAIPYLLVVILLTVVMGSGLSTIIAAMTITGWIGMARIVRGEILRLKARPFVQAAIALGASPPRILCRHLIPNALGPIIVTMTFTVPMAIFTEAFLSFLGLGVQAPVASWGTMAADALSAMRYYPWRLAFPAAFICVTMFAFYIVGDALRDCIDPRLR